MEDTAAHGVGILMSDVSEIVGDDGGGQSAVTKGVVGDFLQFFACAPATPATDQEQIAKASSSFLRGFSFEFDHANQTFWSEQPRLSYQPGLGRFFVGAQSRYGSKCGGSRCQF